MIGKFIVLAVAVAVASAEPCGYLSTGFSGCGSRVLNFGCNTQVVSATPCCSPIAVPSCVVDPIPTETVTPVVSTGVVSTGVYGSGVYGSGAYGSGVYGSGAYGSGVYGGYGYGSVLGGCGSTVY